MFANQLAVGLHEGRQLIEIHMAILKRHDVHRTGQGPEDLVPIGAVLGQIEEQIYQIFIHRKDT